MAAQIPSTSSSGAWVKAPRSIHDGAYRSRGPMTESETSSLSQLALDQQLHASLKDTLDLEVVQQLLAAGADANSRDPANHNATPLHKAAALLDPHTPGWGEADLVTPLVGPLPLKVPLLELLQLLVEAGADVTAQDALGQTPLQVALSNGNTACVGFLALRAETVNTDLSSTQVIADATSGSSNLILYALEHRHWAAVPLLIQAGAPWPDDFQPPAWDAATSKRRGDDAADVDMQCLEGLLSLQLQTALLSHEACSSGQVSKAAAFDQFLGLLQVDAVSWIDAAADQLEASEAQHILSVLSTTQQLVAAPSKVEQLLGLLAVQQPSIFRAASSNERAAVLDQLRACLHLQHVMTTLLQPKDRGYAMHWAAEFAAVVQLRILQMLGADLSLAVRNTIGDWVTPLLMACTTGHGPQNCALSPSEHELPLPADQYQEPWRVFQQVEEDLSSGTAVATYIALPDRKLRAVQLLVEAGAAAADPIPGLQRGRYLRLLLAGAACSGLAPVVEYLLPRAVQAAPEQAHLPLGERLLTDAIFSASLGGDARCLSMLVGASGGPESQECVAALLRLVDNLEGPGLGMLLAEGVPINQRLRGWAPPLQVFLRATRVAPVGVERAVFDLLLASGADVNLLDSDGLTPLMVAVYCATQLKAQWLLEAGADPRARDGAGRSLMDHALDTGDSAWVEWVKTHGRPSAAELMKALLRSIEGGQASFRGQGKGTSRGAAVRGKRGHKEQRRQQYNSYSDDEIHAAAGAAAVKRMEAALATSHAASPHSAAGEATTAELLARLDAIEQGMMQSMGSAVRGEGVSTEHGSGGTSAVTGVAVTGRRVRKEHRRQQHTTYSDDEIEAAANAAAAKRMEEALAASAAAPAANPAQRRVYTAADKAAAEAEAAELLAAEEAAAARAAKKAAKKKRQAAARAAAKNSAAVAEGPEHASTVALTAAGQAKPETKEQLDTAADMMDSVDAAADSVQQGPDQGRCPSQKDNGKAKQGPQQHGQQTAAAAAAAVAAAVTQDSFPPASKATAAAVARHAGAAAVQELDGLMAAASLVPAGRQQLAGRRRRGAAAAEEEGMCVVCLDAKRSVLLLPCRHLCCCGDCSQLLQARAAPCPMCRQDVREHMEVYV